VKGQTGGIIDKEMPLAISNVMLVNPATARAIAWASSSSKRRAAPGAQGALLQVQRRSRGRLRARHGKEKDERTRRARTPSTTRARSRRGKPPAADAKPAAKPGKEAQASKAAKPTRRKPRRPSPRACRCSTARTIVPALMKQFGYKTRMQVPRVTKITLNMGVGEAVADKKILENASATCRRSPARSR
jgi:ribosomal protein L24